MTVTAQTFARWRFPPDENPGPRSTKFWEASPPLVKPRWDWTAQGVQLPVRDQDGWNACVSFAVTAMVEARFRIAHGRAIRLVSADAHCCLLGGDATFGFNPMAIGDAVKTAGIRIGAPDGPPLAPAVCADRSAPRQATGAFGYVGTGNAVLNHLVVHGPLLVEIRIPEGFYATGQHDVLTFPAEPPDSEARHAMLLLGYDAPAKTALLLNSFGSGWGNGGFAMIAFGSGGLVTQRDAFAVDLA